jgi:Putative binding domain, N-terminal/Viral BACON domain
MSPIRRRAGIVAGALCFVALAAGSVVHAQTVSNPRIVEFHASTEHDVTLPDGRAALRDYSLEIYLAGASAPIQTIPIGKPTPGSNRIIRHNFSHTLTGWALPGPTYVARIAANGPGGTSRSLVSNAFVFPAPTCSYAVAPPTVTLAAAAGSGSVTVTTTSGCSWQVSDNASWLTPGVSSGSGAGTVTFSVSPNTSSTPRTAHLTVAGVVVTVTQRGTPCGYNVTPTTVTLAATAGSGSVRLATTPGCSWQVSDDASWLTPAVTSGSGGATVTFAVTANTGASARTAQLSIAGIEITVTQQGATCTYEVTPTTLSIAATAGSSHVTVTATSGCTWQVSDNVSWLAPEVASGSGGATIRFSVTANTSASSRTARLTIAGIAVAVTQRGSCSYAVTPPAVTLAAGATSSSVLVTTATGCTWQVSENASWLTPGVSSGSGARSVSFSVTANTGASVRSAQLIIAGVAVTVTQQGTCSYNVSPATITLAPEAGSGVIRVTTTAGCAWQVSDNDSWLTPARSSGSGNGTITASVTANVSVTPRTARVTVAGFTVVVTQRGLSATDRDTDGDGMPDVWESAYGLDATNSGDGRTDPDGDGVSSHDEYRQGTHPRGFFRRYFAEGVSNNFFHTRFALLQPGSGAAHVQARFLKSDGSRASHVFQIEGRRRMTLDPSEVPALGAADFSTIIESDTLLVAARTMTWDARGFGAHAETAVAAPARSWYLAEGATHGGFDLFYLLQNPNTVAAQVRIRYLRPSGAPLDKNYVVAPLSRKTIWVDMEDVPASAERQPLSATDVSAVIQVTNGPPIIVERAMYFSRGSEAFVAGHESAGVTAPSTRWFFAEGATGPFFDLFLLLANPTNGDADVLVSYLLPDGATLQKNYLVGANSRVTISVDGEELPEGSGDRPLDNVAVSSIVESQNGVPIIAERSMWFPATPKGAWSEAHNSPGATTTGVRWALAEGEVGGPADAQTYVLIANTSAFAGSARVTLVYEDGTAAEHTVALPPSSRTNVDISSMFADALDRRFGVILESLGASPAQLVVEWSMYTNSGGVTWASGTNALGTKLP